MHNQNRQLTVAARPEARSHEKVELQSAAKVTIPKWVMIVMLSARVVPRPAPHEARGRKTLHGFLYKHVMASLLPRKGLVKRIALP